MQYFFYFILHFYDSKPLYANSTNLICFDEVEAGFNLDGSGHVFLFRRAFGFVICGFIKTTRLNLFFF